MFPIVEAGPSLETASLPAFVVARDGLYLRKRSLLGLSQTKVGRVAHLPEGKEFVDYALPKVPADLMARAVGFFRAVYRLHKTEAAVLLLWRDGSFDLAVPDQKVSSVSVKFDVSDGELPAGSRLVGTMHSHGGFSAASKRMLSTLPETPSENAKASPWRHPISASAPRPSHAACGMRLRPSADAGVRASLNHAAPKVTTLRATSPLFILSKASWMRSSGRRAEIISSSLRRPSR